MQDHHKPSSIRPNTKPPLVESNPYSVPLSHPLYTRPMSSEIPYKYLNCTNHWQNVTHVLLLYFIHTVLYIPVLGMYLIWLIIVGYHFKNISKLENRWSPISQRKLEWNKLLVQVFFLNLKRISSFVEKTSKTKCNFLKRTSNLNRWVYSNYLIYNFFDNYGYIWLYMGLL
jgi:hypothetical protein